MKVLAIDDDVMVRSFLKRYFSQKYGITVIEAADGLEGLQLIEEEFPDLVFLDIQMPVMNGIECLEILRADPIYGKIPVMMFTATQEKEYVQRLVELGISDFIAKPLEIKELNTRITKALELLNKKSERQNTVINKNNLSMLKIMMVDGNQRFRSSFESMFVDRYDILQAKSGMQVLQLCKNTIPDVLCIGDGLSLITEDMLLKKIQQLDPLGSILLLSCAEWKPAGDKNASLFSGWIKKSELPERFSAEVDRCIVDKRAHQSRLRLISRNYVIPKFMDLLKEIMDVEEEHVVEDYDLESKGLDLFSTVELFDPAANSRIKVGIQGSERKLLRVIARLKEESSHRHETRREIIDGLVRSLAAKVGEVIEGLGITIDKCPVQLVAVPAGSPPVNWSVGFAVKTTTEEKYIAGLIFEKQKIA